MGAMIRALQNWKVPFFLLLTPFLYITIAMLASGVPDLPNSGDAALLELSTRNVFSKGILLGPYSRFLFFHPGPMYFQLRYPVYALFGQRNSSLLIATVLIQSMCMFFALRSARKAGDYSIFLAVSLALYLLSTDKTVWLSEWNPYIVTLPFMLFVVSMAAFASGRSGSLPVAVVSGSLAAQTHISVIPSMAVAGVMSVIFTVYPWFVSSARNTDFRWKPILISVALLILLWAAPLYQQLSSQGGEGNITRIVQFFQDSSPELNGTRALAAWTSVMTRTELGTGEAPLWTRYSVIGLRFALLIVSFVFLRRRGDRPFLASMSLICIALHGASLVSVLQIRGALNDYLLEWMAIIPPLSLFALLGTVASVVPPRFMNWGKWAAAAFLAYTAVALPARMSDFFRADLHPSWEREIAVGELSIQLEENLNWSGNDFYVVSLVNTDQWPVMFGILNSMEKKGLPVGVEDNLLYVPTPVPAGMEPRILYLGILNEQGYTLPGLVAEWNGVGLILR